MKPERRTEDRKLIRSIFLSEAIANAVGAPVAALYGGFMIDFSRVSVWSFALTILAVMAVNQVALAMPLNIAISRRLAKAVDGFRLGSADEETRTGYHRFIIGVPVIQSGLILLRMFICNLAAIYFLQAEFDSPAHMAAVIVFGFYASAVTAIIIYYSIHSAASRLAQGIVESLSRDNPVFAADPRRGVVSALSLFPTFLPTVITSAGVALLVAVMRRGDGDSGLNTVRIVFALSLNMAISFAFLMVSHFFREKRLSLIVKALDDLVVRGDTSKRIPTDLEDYYAWTAHYINRALDAFGLVLSKLESTSRRLAGTVMSFSSQIKETAAAMSQQASAVKETVGTMETSGGINARISERTGSLSGAAVESQELVDSGFGQVQDTIRKMDEIKGSNIHTLEEIGDLTEQISSIGEIIDIINNIANQTRIIAFNAELEASSAGQAGLSFRIVAEEIRRLANNIVDALVGIKGKISSIQQSSGRLLSSSEEGTVKIDEGIQLSAGLNDIFMHIRESAENTALSAREISTILTEQTRSFDQVFTTLKQISEGSEQVLSSTRVSSSEVEKLEALLTELKSLLQRFAYESEQTVFNFKSIA